jgi:integrase
MDRSAMGARARYQEPGRTVEHQRRWQEDPKKACQTEFVFPSRASNRWGSHCNDSGKTWSDAWKKAGLPSGPLVKKGIHNCRHTFAHRLRAAGVPEEDRNALLGHANTDLAQHYALPDLERLLAYAELIVQRKETTVLRAVG